MSAVPHCMAPWKSKTAEPGAPNAQISYKSHRRALRRWWSGTYFQKWGNKPLLSLTFLLLLETDTNGCYGIIFSWVASYAFDMNFEKDRPSSKSKIVDGEVWIDSVACTVFWLSPYYFFLWGYIKYQVFCELPENIPDLKTKLRQGIASIAKDKLQKVFESLENRLSFVDRQDGSHFERLLNF